MVIVSQDEKKIVFVDSGTSVCSIQVNDHSWQCDEVMIICNCESLGIYQTESEAREVLNQIILAYAEGDKAFYMPQSDEDCLISSKEKLPDFYGNVESKTMNFGE